MEDVKKHHQRVCKQFHSSLDFSLDGVQESKSSSISADIFTVSFKNCRTVYPVRIIRPINKFKYNEQENVKQVINDINASNCCLQTAVCDNPKRATLRCALGSGACFGCEYCISRAVYVYGKDKIGNKTKKGHLAWPYSTANGPKRTIEDIIKICEQLEQGQNLSREECKGIYGTSHLLHQENFHLIYDVPAEYMHSGCIGVVKRLLELSFNVGENRERNTTRKLTNVSSYNILISKVKAVREFNRRFRYLDFGVLKAQEFRNIILFYFIIVIDCIPNEFPREKKIWLQLAYIVRACILPNNEFAQISNKVIKDTANSFYKNFEIEFGEKNCSYSVHMIGGHILEIKGDEPLTAKSAFKYENFYAEMKSLFQPGTISTSKQILSNCFMKRQLENHSCEKSIFYDIEKPGKENNFQIYTVSDDNKYHFYNIKKIIDEDTFLCNPQGKFIYNCPLLKNLNWEKVGVFLVGPYSDQEVIVTRPEISGKVIAVENFLLTCPNNVLREQ